MIGWMRKYAFLLLLIIFFIAADIGLQSWDPIGRYDVFSKNDFQRTLHHHPEAEWPAVFYGNSSVIASYDEAQSSAGLVNLGLDYGKITDLDAILSRKLAPVGNTLILGVNVFTFMDNLPTDPSYIWHKKGYEPYLYFYRDAIARAVQKYALPYVKGEAVAINRKQLYTKALYYGRLKGEDLDGKIADFHRLYGERTMDDFRRNLAALDRVIAYAREHDIDLRVLWMPWNPVLTSPDYVFALKERVAARLEAANVPFTDWMDKFAQEHFHDLGHLNVESGRPLFTKEMDEWVRGSYAKS